MVQVYIPRCIPKCSYSVTTHDAKVQTKEGDPRNKNKKCSKVEES